MAAPGVSDRGDVFGFVSINRAEGRALVSRVLQIIVIDPLFLPSSLTLPVEPPIIRLEILKSSIHFILNHGWLAISYQTTQHTTFSFLCNLTLNY